MGTLVLIVVILYVLLSCFFSFHTACRSRSLQKGLLCLVLCLFLPGAGFVFLWFCDWLAEKQKPKDYSWLYVADDFHRDRLSYLQEPDREKELNQVPMEEALTINDFSFRRGMIMQLLNGENTLQYLDVLHSALGNEDTETTHYASAVIMELQRKVQEELIQREVRFERSPDNPDVAREWESLLYQVLKTSLFDAHNRRRYFPKYYRVSDVLLAQKEEAFYLHRIQVLFLEGNYTRAEEFCRAFLERFPRSEDAVLCQLELFIKTKNAAGMRKFLKALPGTPVRLTQKTLQYIRVFQEDT